MKRFRTMVEEGRMDINMANVLMLLSGAGLNPGDGGRGDDADMLPPQSPGRVFECKTCNRRFTSFQALGGHRASHKKPRLLADQSAQSLVSKPKTHECSVCGLEFAIGQALGGHMRRHKGVTGHGMFVGGHGEKKTSSRGGDGGDKRMLGLDLNMPPMENDAEIPLLTFTLGLPVVVDS